MSKKVASISCPTNTLIHTENAVFGVLPTTMSSFTHCHPDSVSSSILFDQQIRGSDNPIKNCSSLIDYSKTKQYIAKKCDQKASCDISIADIYSS